MRRTALLLAFVVTACGSPVAETASPPSTDRPPVEVLAFEPDGSPVTRMAAIGERPIDLDVLAGWTAAERPGRSLVDGEVIEARPDTTYVFVTGMTGCRSPERVEAAREGDELKVRWGGGKTTPTCLRSYTPHAQLAFDPSTMEGVRRINGVTPVDPNGPGKLTGFVELGPTGVRPPPPAVLGSPQEEALRRLGGPEVAEALDRPVAEHAVGYAFALPGCRAEHAVLLVTSTAVNAHLVGGETARCAAPELYVAVFELPSQYLPAGAVLGG